MTKEYDLTVKIGTYQKDGETKNRYMNIGSVMKGEHGPFIIMDRTFNPAGVSNPENRESLIVSMFKVKPKEDQGYQQASSPDLPQPFQADSQIPF